MKKLLSIMLAALMLLGMIACTGTPAQPDQPEQPTDAPVQPTEAPAETTPEPEATTEYEGLALQLKNKTGLTIKALYISEKGVDLYAKKLNSVVEEGWQDKEVDPENYEKYIYIVREAGKEMEVTVVFEDETSVKWDVGTLAMYDELSLKKGADPANWEHEPAKDEDKMMLDFMVALGKTADNFYPGYELIPVELKNKTGKGIKEFYFYEEGGDPKAYNNMIDYLYTPAGEKMDVLMSGKAKEGGMYLFKCFIRPHTENYYIDVVFDDGATITYPIEGWFKPDGDGNLPNEISLKNAEDPDDIKVQYDDGVPEPIDYLAEALAKGYIVDQWYPTYTETTMDAETVAALRAGQAMIPVPAPEEPAEPTEPTEPDAPAAEVPAGYTGLHLMIKNKSGREIKKIYLFPNGEDKGKNIFKTLADALPTEDETAEGKPHEIFVYVLRETAKLGAMTLKVRYADDTEEDYELKPLEDYTVFTIKDTVDGFKQKVSDDADDIAAMDAVAAAGVSTDGVEFAPLETAEAPAAEVPAGYTGLHLMLKNKSGKEIYKVYLFPNGEDKGKNIFKTVVEGNIPTEDETVEGKPHEVFAYVFRETAKLGAMTLIVRYADDTEETFELKALEDYTVFTVKADEFKQKVADDPEDIASMDAVAAPGVSTDGVEFAPIA